MTFANALTIPFGASHGTSNEADFVATKREEGRSILQSLFSIGFGLPDAYDELYGVAQECGVEGWDGGSAKPVSKAVFQQAYHFLQSLPFGTVAPSVAAEPDGHITFEWYRSPSRVISVSVDSHGFLHYAAIIGLSKAYGSEPLIVGVPKLILDLIRQVMR